MTWQTYGENLEDNLLEWLNAGVLEDGEWRQAPAGVPQGSSIGLLLANVYLHYAFDLWVQRWREKVARGDMIVIRFPDDIVVGFQYRWEAEQFQTELRNKLGEVKQWLRAHLHSDVPKVGEHLRRVVQGYFHDYGVPRNGPALCLFRHAVYWLWYRSLRRRSQRHRSTKKLRRRFGVWAKRFLPIPRITRPYPEQRLAVMT